jgi:hypothetical protein
MLSISDLNTDNDRINDLALEALSIYRDEDRALDPSVVEVDPRTDRER